MLIRKILLYQSITQIVCVLSFITIRMITPQLNQKMYLNRKSQKPRLTEQELVSKMDKQTYEITIASFLEYCRQLEISQSTVFLGKAYLDITIKKLRVVKQSELSLLCICCIWIAIKFNESAETSSNFNLAIMHQHGNGSFSAEELIKAQIMVYGLLNYKLAYTTPYHYIDTFFQSFPWFNAIKKVLPDMIDFSITIAELSCESAEDLFFGIFIACLQIKLCTLTTIQQSVLKAQIADYEAVKRISEMIIKYYNIAIYGADGMDEQTQEQENCLSQK